MAKLLSVEEVAAELSVSVHCVRNWIRDRKLPKVKLGLHLVRIPREAVDQMVERGYIPALEKKARHGR